MKEYNGLYYVLYGVILFMEGIGFEDIKVSELLKRF